MVPVKLVNHSPSRRVGPLETLDRGQYKGQKVEDIIRRFPQYIMYCVKEWLDISPWQALLFEEATGGGIIPDRYIKEKSSPQEWSSQDQSIYNANKDLFPNYDFYPEFSPSWWKNLKASPEFRSGSPYARVKAYEKYCYG